MRLDAAASSAESCRDIGDDNDEEATEGSGSSGNVEAGCGGRDFAMPVGHGRGMTCLNNHGRGRAPFLLGRDSALQLGSASRVGN